MLFHELSGFPVHEFAFGAIGAALRFGRFRSDFFEALARIGRGLSASRRGGEHLGSCRAILRVIERPFQNAMNDVGGTPPNGRSEMRVLPEAEHERAERLFV